MVKAGADVKIRNRWGVTPLRYAILSWGRHRFKRPRGSEHILALLTAGADVNAKDEDGFTPLHFASMSNNEPDHIQILLGNGANIMAQNKWGFTPLHWAAIASTAKQIDALLLAGADIDAKDEFGKTPLHWAVTYRNNKFTKKLLTAGIDTTAMRRWSDWKILPAIYWGTAQTSSKNVQVLIDAGANTNLKDKGGQTSWDYIQKNYHLKGTEIYWVLNDAQYN